jgi:hypothetical protein
VQVPRIKDDYSHCSPGQRSKKRFKDQINKVGEEQDDAVEEHGAQTSLRTGFSRHQLRSLAA